MDAATARRPRQDTPYPVTTSSVSGISPHDVIDKLAGLSSALFTVFVGRRVTICTAVVILYGCRIL